ncbi:hypothetical protein NC653_037405 [Populus alba x Populus x berolinensis]|uniref:Uncharacterized protein n=1 Tax=Populus alba x Populus x berolinensis TaxID=444605 RepID=A0AAD6PS16_9ROSI|nr:hypothetical protein NC653_037405 [Populus alba x Populus x berolinensis]
MCLYVQRRQFWSVIADIGVWNYVAVNHGGFVYCKFWDVILLNCPCYS